MNETFFLVAIFIAALIVAFSLISYLSRRMQLHRNIDAAQAASRAQDRTASQIDSLLGSENEYVRHYYNVQKNDKPDSLRMRLIRAGFFKKRGLLYFNLIRMAVAGLLFVGVWFVTTTLSPATGKVELLLFSAVMSGLSFILCNFALEKLGDGRRTAYRKLFPDFMDLLIVCVDAGLSIEAALDRVTREFLLTNRDFGTHLSIIGIEVRAGRPLYQALFNFAERVQVEEVRSLAILFRQSVELGSSVSKTLRVFSNEMRQQRIIRAEEKANSLPIKMLFPLGLFLFPVNLVIVLVPILIAILKMFLTLSPGG
ncbi:type II secretion system F family protein [Actibacterium sp. MT2.3-13A]|uniref:type II secretion system F family protein n=1 Tax=Actibacterium sp. MT2.3-13A TaxID=2828332 RepID=UPI001BA9CE5C|nr:type II secretion system F family protein [Actibacterium sp. MT2.3-13A]